MAVFLKLLLDECIHAKVLVAKLRAAGHDVRTVTELALGGQPDDDVFDAAIADNRIVLTINTKDFDTLAGSIIENGRDHPGVFFVYRNNVQYKDMNHDEIVKAIANLQGTGFELKNSCHKLNECNY